jgi:7-cyano-7-deazaguanine synthase
MSSAQVPTFKTQKALVVLSGGQDSTTCLYWARDTFGEVHAVTFNYGQKHVREIESALAIGKLAGVASHEVINIPDVLKGTSPLTNKSEVLEQYPDGNLPGGLEKTFVPGRNILFLVLAANRAYVLGAPYIITGICQEDFGGYPDCRDSFRRSLEQTLQLGLELPVHVLAPLMFMTKAKSIEFAQTLEGCMEAMAYSHTSYDGAYPPTGCDHATMLRAKGFAQANVPDPLVVRAWNEGLMELPATPNYDVLRKK